METWYLILVSISISLLLKAFYDVLLSPSRPTSKARPTLPPSPPIFPIIGNIVWLRRTFSEMEPFLRSLHSKLGPIISLRIGSRTAIFISDRSLAHQALVQNGAVFADRPRVAATDKITSTNQKNISSAAYGATWRLLRRNLTAEILHPSRVKSYSHARKWVLQVLTDRLAGAGPASSVRVVDHFHYAMFCLLVLMCFGDKLEEKQIMDIERVERNMILNLFNYNILNFFPMVTRVLFRKKWEEFLKLRRDQEDVLIPLIRARKEALSTKKGGEILAYVDTLFDLELPDEKRKLNDDELVTLCNEFLNAGTDTTSTVLQWIMARLVKHPDIQERVYSEIKEAVGPAAVGEEIGEDRLGEMAYLKAVVLEGLRRHPPGHFVLPHAVSEDVELGGHLVPRQGTLNFMVADFGWDPKVWEDPMEFKPERFMKGGDGEGVDITGSREIKMMPFGAGRRICPASGLAILHLEYFVANLVWKFEWKEVEGVGVDLTEKQEFTMVMKFPLQARLIPRNINNTGN